MAYRNKTYICFDADNDIHYYRLMQAWKHNRNSFFESFNFYNAHEVLDVVNTYTSESKIKDILYSRLEHTKIMVVLIGSQTRYLYRYVRWEIEQAIYMEIPIIGVNLNGIRHIDISRCPPILRNQLSLHVSFNLKIIEKALNEWPSLDENYRSQYINNEPYYYIQSTYNELAI